MAFDLTEEEQYLYDLQITERKMRRTFLLLLKNIEGAKLKQDHIAVSAKQEFETFISAISQQVTVFDNLVSKVIIDNQHIAANTAILQDMQTYVDMLHSKLAEIR